MLMKLNIVLGMGIKVKCFFLNYSELKSALSETSKRAIGRQYVKY